MWQHFGVITLKNRVKFFLNDAKFNYESIIVDL